MKHIKRFSEDIKVPIELGDTILGGRFKNKKVLVKKIGKNKKGDITVNDKPLLKYRIVKESISQEDINNQLAYLIDDGFEIIYKADIIQIFKKKNFVNTASMSNLVKLNWSDIESDILPFIEMNKDSIKVIILIYPNFTESGDNPTYVRKFFSVDEILEINFDKLVKINIRLK